ncbi:hypothetical protein DC522_18055 [Microvirga sp. KLBC 81]|uniref:tripartite tricarboxylate transporter TctB family protein n=1 Tax=Microvirga sp. KLBC 81 TaxID=1862707 RepID=UPI000D516D76|nr:tripartite tricarboxylate transporter TctB family protein [Microvirga sp. KLBC 81]PVE23000.1 hypothetical protein DC522_18055 [Microvirga sp. KLBC 81]
MLPHKSLRRADVVASCTMMGLGIAVIYSGSQMPWTSTLTGGAAQWYLSPGLFPTVVGALLILFSARVLLTAIKEGGLQGIGEGVSNWLRRFPRNRPIHRAIIITLLMAAYIFLGLGKINFVVASSIFLFVSIAIFWWKDAQHHWVRTIGVTLAVSIGVPFVVSYLFSTFLFVPMP